MAGLNRRERRKKKRRKFNKNRRQQERDRRRAQWRRSRRQEKKHFIAGVKHQKPLAVTFLKKIAAIQKLIFASQNSLFKTCI